MKKLTYIKQYCENLITTFEIIISKRKQVKSKFAEINIIMKNFNLQTY